MKGLILITILMFGTTVMVFGQRPTQVPRPTPMPGTAVNRNAGQISQRSFDLRMTEKFPTATEDEIKAYSEIVLPRYRNSTEAERAELSPSPAVAESYAEFLKGKGTHITRLTADKGCYTKDDVVSAAPECVKYTMPGGGSAYSFRTEDYRLQRLADLNFKADRFEALGVLTHGILVYLGDVPIERVSLDSAGVKHLMSIEPAGNFAEAGVLSDKLMKSFTNESFSYASVMKAIPGRTYVLRSIAYYGTADKTVKSLIYNEMDFDERRDIVVVFRVAAMNSGSDVTIVWKELRNKKAPKLVPGK